MNLRKHDRIASIVVLLAGRMRGSIDLSASLLAGNLLDTIIMWLILGLKPVLEVQRGFLALYPQISAVTGALVLSSASRLTSLSVLGLARRADYLEEAFLAVGVGVALMVMATPVVAFVLGLPGVSVTGAAILSLSLVTILATGFLAKVVPFLVRVRLNPDNVLPAILTSLVDLAVLAIGLAIFSSVGGGDVHVALVVAILSWGLGLAIAVAVLKPRQFIDSLYSLVSLQAFEAAAGVAMAVFAQPLIASGLLAVIPPVNKTAGSVAASMVARATTHLALYGERPGLGLAVASAVYTSASAIPSMAYIVAIYYIVVSRVYGIPPAAEALLLVVPAGLVTAIIASLVAWGLVFLAVKSGIDPDSSALPISTGLADFMGVVAVSMIAFRLT